MRATVLMRAVRRLVEHLARTKTTASYQTLAPPEMSGLPFKKPNKLGIENRPSQNRRRCSMGIVDNRAHEVRSSDVTAPTARADAR